LFDSSSNRSSWCTSLDTRNEAARDRFHAILSERPSPYRRPTSEPIGRRSVRKSMQTLQRLTAFAFVALGACTPAAPASSPFATTIWGVGAPLSPSGDGFTAPEQTSAATTTAPLTTSATLGSNGSATNTTTAYVDERGPLRAGAEHDTLPRSPYFAPRAMNTGDPCGLCVRAR
jgi:hypothetical protein